MPTVNPVLNVISADFLAAAKSASELLSPTLAEIAFAGRSNVGKSSLLNCLFARKNLVRAGATPGTTRQVNLFGAKFADGLELRLVDLPGYGYAKRSKGERRSWGEMIEGYLLSRVTLRAVVLLIDIRRGIEDDDRDLIEFVSAMPKRNRPPVPLVLVATKIDKLSASARKPAVAKLRDPRTLATLGFSAETGEGRDALWLLLRKQIVSGIKVRPISATQTSSGDDGDKPDSLDNGDPPAGLEGAFPDEAAPRILAT